VRVCRGGGQGVGVNPGASLVTHSPHLLVPVVPRARWPCLLHRYLVTFTDLLPAPACCGNHRSSSVCIMVCCACTCSIGSPADSLTPALALVACDTQVPCPLVWEWGSCRPCGRQELGSSSSRRR
jgi:hypothetical protein